MKTLLHNLKLLSVLIYLVVIKIPSLVIISPIITIKRSIDRLIIWSHEVAHPDAEYNKNSDLSKRVQYYMEEHGESWHQAVNSAKWEKENKTLPTRHYSSFEDYHDLSSPNKDASYWGR